MSRVWKEQQLQAIENTDTDLIVTASAGSGKTSAMIERALRLVVAGTPVRRITMLTFTEAAAAEMRDKMRTALMEFVRTQSGERRDYLVEQIDDLHYANISTIHGFCAGLVREFFEHIPLSPTVGILEPDMCDDLRHKAFDKLLAARTGESEFDDMRMTVGLRSDDDLYAIITQMYDFMTNQPDHAGWVNDTYQSTVDVPFEDSRVAKWLVRFVTEEAQSMCDALEALLATVPVKEAPTIKAAGIVLARCRGFAECTTVRAVYSAYDHLDKERVSPSRNSSYANQVRALNNRFKSGLKKELEEIMKTGTYDEVVMMHERCAPFLRLLFDLALQFEEFYRLEKLDFNGMDFADLERYTIQILSDEDIRTEVRQRNDYVFVDEFQDTNHVQDAIIAFIAPPERLFVVGDSKQCIYRFRLAEPRIFLERLARLSAENKAVTFSHNFRSDKSILDAVNMVFDVLMTPSFGGVDYKRTDRLLPRDDAPDSGSEGFRYCLVPRGPGEKSVARGVYSVMDADWAQADAEDAQGQVIARFINDHLGQTVMLRGPHTLTYKDFAILFDSRTSGKKIIRTLLGKGYPLNLDTFAGDVGLRDVRVLLQYADLLDNGMQDYPLLTVMRSAFGSFGDADLAAIRRAANDRYCPFYRACDIVAKGESDLSKRVAAFLDKVARYRFRASFVPLCTLFRQILLDDGYSDYLLGQEDGLQRLSAVHTFLDSIERKHFASNLTLLCAHYRAMPVTEVPVVSDDADDRIVVSTMHASKGLEYPVVILGNCGNVRNNFRPAVRLDKELGAGVEYYDRIRRTRRPTFAQAVIDLWLKLKQNEDRLRLMYVAMTRAQCRLLFTGEELAGLPPVPRFKGNMAGWLQYAAAEDPNIEAHRIAPPEEAVVRPAGTGRKQFVLDDDLDDVLRFSYKHDDAVQVGKKYTVTRLNAQDHTRDEDDEPPLVLPSFLDREDDASLGTLYHKVLQYIDYACLDEAAVKADLSRLVSEGVLTDDDVQKVDSAVVARCLALPLLRTSLLPSVKVYHEQRFLLSALASDVQLPSDERVVIQGVVDMLLDTGEDLIVLDFKMSRRKPEDLVEAYKVQLALYCRAMSAAFRRPVTRCVLVDVNRAMCIDMPLS